MKKIITLFALWICVIAISQPVYAIIEADNSKSSNKIIQKKID